MGIGTSDPERIDADSFSTARREGRRHDRDSQPFLRKWDCTSRWYQVSFERECREGVSQGAITHS